MQHFESWNSCFPTHVLPASSHPCFREISTLPSWMYCFMTYLAVQASDPALRDKLVYARLVIREALHHGGKGWMYYDPLFRQQAAINPTLQWSILHPGLLASSLLASTIVGQSLMGGTFCTIYQGCDHLASNCAMAYVPQASSRPATRTQSQSPTKITSHKNYTSCITNC